MPTWMLLALLSSAIVASINILDKLIVDRLTPSIFFFAFWIGVYDLVLGTVLVSVVSVVEFDRTALLGGLLTGSVQAVSLIFLLSALKRGMLSRVVPIWYLYPLIVAIMAAVFLDERLSGVAWGAVVLAVVGAGFVSWYGGTAHQGFGNPKPLFLALAAATIGAASIVMSKHFLDGGGFWQFYAGIILGFGVGMLLINLLLGESRTAVFMVRNRNFMAAVTLLVGLATVATIIQFGAINLAPDVSFVAAINAIQPPLVFLYSLGLAAMSPKIFGSWVIKGTLRPQITGISAITAAVGIISFQ